MSKLSTRHSGPEASPGMLLWQVTNRWQAAQRAALKPFGLTHVQFVLLASLTWLNGNGSETARPTSQRQLAEHAVTDPMMTSQVLRTLEERGLVERAADPADKRVRAISVTAAGAALANQANTVVETCDADFFSILGAEVASFTSALAVLQKRSNRDHGSESISVYPA